MHLSASTSIEAFRNLNTRDQHEAILALMREGGEWCIADCAEALGWERSTVSARFNELKHDGKFEYVGKKPSRTTGVSAMHFKVKSQETLF